MLRNASSVVTVRGKNRCDRRRFEEAGRRKPGRPPRGTGQTDFQPEIDSALRAEISRPRPRKNFLDSRGRGSTETTGLRRLTFFLGYDDLDADRFPLDLAARSFRIPWPKWIEHSNTNGYEVIISRVSR